MSNQTDKVRHGVVKFYIDEKLYGFLIDNESQEEIYIPVSGLIDEIKKNNKVSYIESNGANGKEAINVRVLKK